MNISIEILTLVAYEGPNIFGPQPGVLLRVRCDADRSRRIKDALKDGAQFIGMVLAYLDVTTVSEGDNFIISASFTTPTPAIGKALAQYVVDGIRAEAATDGNGDDASEWDADSPLLALRQRRRQEALPMPVLQLLAEARKRDVPVLMLPDGRVQLGYGAKSWQCDPAALQADSTEDSETAMVVPQPPWENLGAIPLFVVTGEQNRSTIVQRVADYLQQTERNVTVQPDASYADTVALLSQSSGVQCLVIGLTTADILRRGVAFMRCTQSIITDMNGERPAEACTHTEWAQALGVPMLLSSNPTILNITVPALLSLASYAPYGVFPLNDLDKGIDAAHSS